MTTFRKSLSCLYCNEKLAGRIDKKFCDEYCKSAYHYQKSRVSTSNFFSQVDKQLRLNRKILKTYNKAGEALVQAKALLDEGFNPNFFTHCWKNKSGEIFWFVYEFGFIKQQEKFFLMQWKENMQQE